MKFIIEHVSTSEIEAIITVKKESLLNLMKKRCFKTILVLTMLTIMPGCGKKNVMSSVNIEISDDTNGQDHFDDNSEPGVIAEEGNKEAYESKSDLYSIYNQAIGNSIFDEFIEQVVALTDEEEIEKIEWIETNVCLRVATQYVNKPDGIFRHCKDYFFIYDDGIKWFGVDYPPKNSDIETERHIWSACDYSVKYEDITFDGKKDVTIFLGHAGSRGTEHSCAYINRAGEFVYAKSFESIPNYLIDDKEEAIYGWYYDGTIQNEVIEKYKFDGEEFILESSEEYSDDKYGQFHF